MFPPKINRYCPIFNNTPGIIESGGVTYVHVHDAGVKS